MARTTFIVKSQRDWLPIETEAEGLLTYEEGLARTHARLIDWLEQHLIEHRLYATAKGHSLRIEPLQGIAMGMRVVSHCEDRPCPWLGDTADYAGPREGSVDSFKVWFQPVAGL